MIDVVRDAQKLFMYNMHAKKIKYRIFGNSGPPVNSGPPEIVAPLLDIVETIVAPPEIVAPGPLFSPPTRTLYMSNMLVFAQ